ncbi:MAG: TA system VapC family ribonuclease toxin [Luteolibacter sp.]|uniref:TA system VapC family ribonuclease toxin n=1 Tax=Luteolibacter sp. TaxID=1962973 RepID=UPI003263FE26
MILLPDVNVLLYLANPDSPFHAAAKAFFMQATREGWATCPITENGFIRIFGHPNFPGGTGSVESARKTIRQWKSLPGHQFWRDDLSLCDASQFPDLPNSKHLTDCYLLALAANRGGKLATFDKGINPAWVPGGAHALLVLDPQNA